MTYDVVIECLHIIIFYLFLQNWKVPFIKFDRFYRKQAKFVLQKLKSFTLGTNSQIKISSIKQNIAYKSGRIKVIKIWMSLDL